MPEAKAEKDPTRQLPVPNDWRPFFEEIIRAFVSGDYEISKKVLHVKPVDADTVNQVKSYITSYGEKLVDLPQNSWDSSVSQWMGGYWDVLVDLWTAESGASDLVLSARVFEEADRFQIEIIGLYVP